MARRGQQSYRNEVLRPPARPHSAGVGSSGAAGTRLVVVTASPRAWPARSSNGATANMTSTLNHGRAFRTLYRTVPGKFSSGRRLPRAQRPALGNMGKAGRGREQAGRRRQHRHRNGSAFGAGWVQRADGPSRTGAQQDLVAEERGCKSGGDGHKAASRDHGRSPNCVVLRGELANSRRMIPPILRPISVPSTSALRKWMPPQTRALSTSSVSSENL